MRERLELQRQQQLEEVLAFLDENFEIDDHRLRALIQRRRGTGLSSDQINRLDSIKVTDDLEETLREDCCSICLDPFDANMTIRKLA